MDPTWAFYQQTPVPIQVYHTETEINDMCRHILTAWEASYMVLFPKGSYSKVRVVLFLVSFRLYPRAHLFTVSLRHSSAFQKEKH